MALKIRCPHCNGILLAEDWTAGEGRNCPRCGRGFTVPLPATAAPAERAATAVSGVTCARCRAALAPGTRQCRHCLSDPTTGARLPMGRRLRLLSAKFWFGLSLAAVAMMIAGFLIVPALRRAPPEVVSSEPIPPPTVDAEGHTRALVQRVLTARDAPTREAAARELQRAGVVGHAAIASAMSEALSGGAPDPRSLRGMLGLVAILSNEPSAAGRPALAAAARNPALRDAALRALVRSGDTDAVAPAVEQWLIHVKQLLAAERGSALIGDEFAQSAIAEARRRSNEWLAALRTQPDAVIAEALRHYWTTLGWLGQPATEGVGRAIFDLARPSAPAGASAADVVSGIRAARRALEGAAAAPAATDVRAAVLLILAQNVPQYRSLHERLLTELLPGLLDRDPLVRRRVVWTIARVGGPVLGSGARAPHPQMVDEEAVRATTEWAVGLGLLSPGGDRSRGGAASDEAPLTDPTLALARRVVTPRRQLEHALLSGLHGEPGSAVAALRRWRSERIGYSPRAAALLDAARSGVSPAARLAAALLAAEDGSPGAESSLETLRANAGGERLPGFAADAALAVLRARRGDTLRDWPDNSRLLEADLRDPAIVELLGGILALGGPPLRARLVEGALPDERVRALLVNALDAHLR
ncbi:MAG: hypothetical protein HRU75_01930 [Planctomycetia bacterium]|nr:MAG: hypothetical protein HRU75_01930 [Planctomycetia bacterium]